MLQRDTYSLPIVKGVETQEDDKLSSGEDFDQLVNWEFNKLGGVKKRNGLDNLTNNIFGGGTLSKPILVDTLKDELVCISNNQLYAYSPSLVAWVLKGNAPQAIATNTPILNSNNVSQQLRMVEIGNYQIYLYSKSVAGTNGLYFTTIDKQTDTIVIQDAEVISPSYSVKFELVSFASKVYVIYVYSVTPTTIRYVEILGSNYSTLGSTTNLKTDNYFNVVGDSISASTDSTHLYFSYHNSTDNKMSVCKFDSTMTQVWATSVGTARTALIYQSVNAASSTYVGLVYSVDGISKTFNAILNKSGSITTAEQEIDASNAYVDFMLGYKSSTDNLEVIANSTVSSVPVSYQYQIALSTGVFVARNLCSSLWVCQSHGITISNITYYLWLNTDSAQATYLLAEPVFDYISNYKEKYLGKFLQNSAQTWFTGFSEQLGHKGVPILSGTKVLLPVLQANVGLTSVVRLEAETAIDQKLNSLEFHNVLNISGGITKVYDGGYVAEMGFHNYPKIFSIASSAGGAFPAGTYLFKCTYAWTDKSGQYWESSPSNTVTITPTLNQKVTIVSNSLMFTEKSYKDLFLNIYMTQNNGTVYYLSSSTNLSAGNATITVDTNSQVLGTEQLLYTNGGVLENISPPASFSFASSQNRMFIHSSDDKNEVWFCKEIAKGYGIETNDSFVIRGDSVALKGDISAIGAMDEKVVLFKQNSIYASVGQGPNSTGTQGEFSLPQLVMADVGCPYPRSVVVTPQGLMFKSLKGIYTLGRGLDVQYTGVNMELYNTEAITSAQLMETKNQVRFCTQNRTMVFDYYVNAWTTFSNFGCEDSTQWQNNHVIAVGAAENLIKSQGTGYTDNAVAVNTITETGWIHLKDLAGFQRINRMTILGDYVSPHTLAMESYVDYKTSSSDSYTVPVSTDGLYLARIHIKTQKCAAFKFKLTETNIATLGAGFTLAGFSFDVGIKKGLYKTPSTKQG